MKFWFTKPSWFFEKYWATIAFAFFGVLLLLFIFQWISLVKSAQNIWNWRAVQKWSILAWWLSPNIAQAWLIVDKVMQEWLWSLEKEEFTLLYDTATTQASQRDLPEVINHLKPLLADARGYSEDLYSLLWYEKKQRYLIILQNTSEKRPNWWFFGSFALIHLEKWEVSHLEIIDSYLPWYDRPNTTITWPERLQWFLPNRTIHFIWANKVWFTYHDGAHIKTLYEKSYPWQKIRGVVFLTTDMFVELLPEFQTQMRERQFANASIDLIRGNDTRWKKEVYLKNSQVFFEQHKETLLKETIKKLPNLLENHRINFYLTDISWPLHWYLRRNNLTTRFEADTWYFWDSNISFNKIDSFVSKKIRCFDSNDKDILQAKNTEILSLNVFTPWSYTCKIHYWLNVYNNYKMYIRSLEETYGIELWSREEHILWLKSSWDNRGVIHFPKNFTPFQISGDTYLSEIFETPFSNALMYKTQIEENNWESNVFIKFRVE